MRLQVKCIVLCRHEHQSQTTGNTAIRNTSDIAVLYRWRERGTCVASRQLPSNVIYRAGITNALLLPCEKQQQRYNRSPLKQPEQIYCRVLWSYIWYIYFFSFHRHYDLLECSPLYAGCRPMETSKGFRLGPHQSWNHRLFEKAVPNFFILEKHKLK